MPAASTDNERIPVALFAYNRPEALGELLACLQRDRVPLIYAFSDGARNPAHAAGVAEVRTLLRTVSWCEVVLVERRTNLGLGKSLVLGVTEVLDKHDSVIVFEDDLVCVPGTYAYFCAALRHYRDAPAVMSLTGWTHPRITPKDVGENPYLDGRAECWSWATWRRAWTGMEATDALTLIKECRAKEIWPRKYGDDLPKMAEVEHRQNIWAVRWLYWHIVRGGLCLRPPHSLVEHKGIDNLATNVGADNAGWQNPPLQPCPPIPSTWPPPVEHPMCVKLWRKACKDPAPPPTRWQTLLALVKKRLPWSSSRKPQRPLPPVGDVTFSGDYATWDEAARECEGYASASILERVRAAARQVRDGKAACERDGVLITKAQQPWPVIAALHRAASQCGRKIRIVDFGGSLGSLYFQTRHLLGKDTISQWCVVEQPNFVEAGQQEFQDGILTFVTDGESCLHGDGIDVLLLSAVIHYLPDPHAMLDRMVGWKPRHVVVDRTPILPVSAVKDTLALQTVSAIIYPAKYPVWFFERKRFLSHFAPAYTTVEQFDSMDQFHHQGTTLTCQGFIMDYTRKPPGLPPLSASSHVHNSDLQQAVAEHRIPTSSA